MYDKLKLTKILFQPVFKIYKFQLYSKVAYIFNCISVHLIHIHTFKNKCMICLHL